MRVSRYVYDCIGRCKDDSTVTAFLSSCGAGGQNKDKTMSAVRIVDKRTGIVSECQEERSQLQNKNKAFLRMAERLKAHYEAEEAGLKVDLRNNATVQTYNENANRVKDHRTSKSYDYKGVLGGDIGAMIKDVLIELGTAEILKTGPGLGPAE